MSQILTISKTSYLANLNVPSSKGRDRQTCNFERSKFQGDAFKLASLNVPNSKFQGSLNVNPPRENAQIPLPELYVYNVPRKFRSGEKKFRNSFSAREVQCRAARNGIRWSGGCIYMERVTRLARFLRVYDGGTRLSTARLCRRETVKGFSRQESK